MKYLCFIIACFIAMAASSQQNELSWYKTYSGTIGKYPVTMHLHKADKEYYGYYYYNNYQRPFYFSGEDSTEQGRIKLYAYADLEDSEIFSFLISGGKARGSWQKNGDSQKLDFNAEVLKTDPDFDFVFTRAEKKLKPHLEGSPAATLALYSVWPKGRSRLEQVIIKELGSTYEENYQGNETIGRVFLKFRNKFFEDYGNEYRDVADEEVKEAYSGFSMAVDDKSLVMFHNRNIITLAYHNYSYYGGAHGLYGTSYTVISKKSGKHLKLEDLLTETGISKMPKLLEKHFRDGYRLKPGETLRDYGLNVDEIEPVDNFYLTGKGIGFVYLPYEIAAYALGQIEIFIPFSEMEEMLKPEAKALVK